jgi:aminoglycoside phosphotransferase (APT) family kinase protein
VNLWATTLEREQMREVLTAALRDCLGAEVRLEGWTARPASKRGKQRAVRYDLDARLEGAPHVRHFQWVGKFYERDNDARRVATVLRELVATDCGARGDLVIPKVVTYHDPLHLLLFTYEAGKSVIAALAHAQASVLPALGRALAALHATPVNLDGLISPAAVLDQARGRIAHLCTRFPAESISLRQAVKKLERQTPAAPISPCFLHGDLGPVQLLWQTGRIVVLDFDKCTRGDPALDLGNLLTQLRRLTLRKPGKLPDFAFLRRGLLEAYARWSPPDPGLAERVGWYEQVMLLRKIHFLASNTARHKEPEAMQQRQAEASRLLEELPALLESG